MNLTLEAWLAFCWKIVLFTPSQTTLNMKHCTVEMTFCGAFFPNMKEKPWLMLIQGVIFHSLLSLKCQRGVLTRCKLSWLINFMLIWLWSQKNWFNWCYFLKYPIYSQVSRKYSPVHVSNSCLRIKSRMPWPFPPFLAPTTSLCVPPQFICTIFHGGNFQDGSLIRTWKQPWSISGWNKMLCPGARGPQGTMEWRRRSSQWLTGRARWIWSETPAWEGCARGKWKTSMTQKSL